MPETKASVRMKAGPKTALAVIGSAAMLVAGCGSNSTSNQDTTSPDETTVRSTATATSVMPPPLGSSAPTSTSPGYGAPGDTVTPGTPMPGDTMAPGGASGAVPGGPSGSVGPGGASGTVPGVGGGSVGMMPPP